jgi:hypothetical protein
MPPVAPASLPDRGFLSWHRHSCLCSWVSLLFPPPQNTNHFSVIAFHPPFQRQAKTQCTSATSRSLTSTAALSPATQSPSSFLQICSPRGTIFHCPDHDLRPQPAPIPGNQTPMAPPHPQRSMDCSLRPRSRSPGRHLPRTQTRNRNRPTKPNPVTTAPSFATIPVAPASLPAPGFLSWHRHSCLCSWVPPSSWVCRDGLPRPSAPGLLFAGSQHRCTPSPQN